MEPVANSFGTNARITAGLPHSRSTTNYHIRTIEAYNHPENNTRLWADLRR